jgi:hypothetical protein
MAIDWRDEDTLKREGFSDGIQTSKFARFLKIASHE